MEQVVLDLGLQGTFAEAAERFVLHANLGAQLRTPAAQPPATLVVEVDGSMIPTRGPDPWREVKVGLVARGEHFVQNKGRGLVTQARFVARLGDYEGFKQAVETDGKGNFLLAHWDGTRETEKKIKDDTKATIRCVPADGADEPGTCIVSGRPSQRRVLFAQAY